jgi:hypothetical protein
MAGMYGRALKSGARGMASEAKIWGGMLGSAVKGMFRR